MERKIINITFFTIHLHDINWMISYNYAMEKWLYTLVYSVGF